MSLRKALALGKERGFLNTFIDQPAVTARLCMRALEEGIEVPYVQDLIRKRRLIPEKPPLHLENWPWAIRIHTLGGFEFHRDGKPVEFSGKVPKKLLELLKAVIALGGREVREDEICDALWPEADGDMAHQSFAMTLHRLRQLLGMGKAIQLREGRLSLDPRYCWVDVRAFEDFLSQAETLWKEGNKDSGAELTRKAVALYKGPFLPREMEEPWILSAQERLRNEFLKSVSRLGLFLQQEEKWEEAIDLYQKGIDADAVVEGFYQGLMTCYHRLDRRPEALTVYGRCKKVLSSTFGIDPSTKTQALYRALLSGQ